MIIIKYVKLSPNSHWGPAATTTLRVKFQKQRFGDEGKESLFKSL